MSQPHRPNVVLIMADQWRGDCLGVAGHPVVRTPFLDRVATRGARFDRAYSATPTCIPARASLMTGQRPASHGRVGYEDLVPWTYPVTLAGEFTAAGYQTQAVGKMHFYPERVQMGFQNVILHSPLGIIRTTRQAGRDPGLVDDYLPWLRQQLGRDATFFDHGVDSNSWVARPWDKPEYTHPTNWVASQAADFLRRRDPTKPFFLFTSFNAPHPPYDPPAWAMDEYRDCADDAVLGDWEDMLDEWDDSHNPAATVGRIDRDILRRARAGYYGHMTHVDQQINFLLEELSHYGVRENTYICFVSDHGEMLGDHRLFRKSVPYEGSARIPMLLSGPGIPPGRIVSDRVVELGDVMPTLLDYAGIAIPESVEGSSMRRLLGDDSSAAAGWRDWLHGEHVVLGQSFQWLTDGREKYIWMSGSGREQLFDLTSDPHERKDLAQRPEWADRRGVWRGRLIDELRGREEGFTDGERLIPGRQVSPTLGVLTRNR